MTKFEPPMKRSRVPEKIRATLEGALDKGVAVSGEVVEQAIGGLRRRFPDATTDQLLRELDRWYLGLAMGGGAAAGAAAAGNLIGVTLPATFTVALAEAGGFVVLTGTYVTAKASLHGVDVTDIDQRKLMLLAALVGPASGGMIEKIAGRTGRHWGRALANGVPLAWINDANKVLGPRFITRYGTRQGIIVLGEQLPLFAGAGIGAAGNFLMARGAVKAMEGAFGDLGGDVNPPNGVPAPN